MDLEWGNFTGSSSSSNYYFKKLTVPIFLEFPWYSKSSLKRVLGWQRLLQWVRRSSNFLRWRPERPAKYSKSSSPVTCFLLGRWHRSQLYCPFCFEPLCSMHYWDCFQLPYPPITQQLSPPPSGCILSALPCLSSAYSRTGCLGSVCLFGVSFPNLFLLV